MMFDEDSIKQAISKQLSTDVNIPVGHRGALATVVTNTGVQIALATKIRDNWRVELIGQHDWQGENSIGAITTLTW